MSDVHYEFNYNNYTRAINFLSGDCQDEETAGRNGKREDCFHYEFEDLCSDELSGPYKLCVTIVNMLL